MGVRGELDRSTMFTILLDVSSKFGNMPLDAGVKIVTRALAAFHDSTSGDMYQFTRAWIETQRPDLMPLTRKG